VVLKLLPPSQEYCREDARLLLLTNEPTNERLVLLLAPALRRLRAGHLLDLTSLRPLSYDDDDETLTLAALLFFGKKVVPHKKDEAR